MNESLLVREQILLAKSLHIIVRAGVVWCGVGTFEVALGVHQQYREQPIQYYPSYTILNSTESKQASGAKKYRAKCSLVAPYFWRIRCNRSIYLHHLDA